MYKIIFIMLINCSRIKIYLPTKKASRDRRVGEVWRIIEGG